MNLELSGKSVVVTGSSRGIGRAIAAAFAREGARVLLNGRDAASLKEAVAALGAGAAGFACDVSTPDGAKALADEARRRFGSLDILVCNVGSGTSVPPGRETHAEWRKMLDINLLAATNTIEACSDAFARAGASIVCISSICGFEALGAPVTYSAAKAALHAYVKGVSRPLGARGIRINAVAPGNIVFEGSVWERKLADNRAAVEEMLERDVPLARLGRPEEVADLCVFLASARAAFITGSIHAVDGGQLRAT